MTSDLAKRDNSRYYTFHREVRHIIEECKSLKNKVLKLIQSRYLKELMSQSKQKGQGQSNQSTKSQRLSEDGHVKKVIHTTHGE